MASQGYDIPSPTQAALTVEPDSDDDDDLVAIPESEIEQSSQPLNPTGKSNQKGKTKAYPPAAPPSRPTVSGQIGSTSTANPSNTRQSSRKNFGGIMTESRYGSGINHLTNLSVKLLLVFLLVVSKILHKIKSNRMFILTLQMRDLTAIGSKMLVLGLAVVLSLNAPPQQSLSVFTGVFVIVWVGSVIVTLNARLLGGRVSLFQSICVLGYCLFPLFVAALVALFIRWLPIRVLLSVCGWAWSVWAAMNFFGGTRLEDGRAFWPSILSVYFMLLWLGSQCYPRTNTTKNTF
ncbi:hypothetical protein KEM48_008264 [Puccinia striiformis f. sp. tritici PST-130]|nr:hypothetical protein KEM48_008264 [Puccinia striiformis f. sp. tritici PST-130]